jgi:type 1 fimbria pilin
MKKYSLVLAMLLASIAPYADASTNGTITFSGQIISAQQAQNLTQIEPQSTTDSSGNPTTQYAVVSVPTGQVLATFPTLSAAQSFATQVTPEVAYRQ